MSNSYSQEKDVSLLIAALEINKVLSNISDFTNWIKIKYDINENEVFDGYKFMLNMSLRGICEQIKDSSKALNLEEDYTTFRSLFFLDMNINEIPNSSEKTILIKNVWMMRKLFTKSKNFIELQKGLFDLNTKLKPFYDLTTKVKLINCLMKQQDIIAYLSKAYISTYFNDNRNGIPWIYTLTKQLSFNENDQNIKHVLQGYKYALEYIWFKLLEEREFETFKFDVIHKSESFIQIDRSIFKKAFDNVVDPIEKINKVSILKPLLILQTFDKKVVKDFLSTSKITEPEYLTKTDEDSKFKYLDYKLLWYGINVSDTRKVEVFNGTFAFESILLGYKELKKRNNNTSKIYVKIFKHPVTDIKNSFDYSFGILIEAIGAFSDASGWMIFFDCATDYSGSGGMQLLHTLKLIDELKKENKNVLEIEDLIVDKKLFIKYIRERKVSSVFDYINKSSTSEGIKDNGKQTNKSPREIEGVIGRAKGKVLELLAYLFYEKSKYNNEEVIFNYPEDGECIDLIIKNEKIINFFECKIDFHDDDLRDLKKQIEKAIKLIEINFPKKTMQANLLIYRPLPDKRKIIIKNNIPRINIIDNFRKTINESRRNTFGGEVDAIIKILDFNFYNKTNLEKNPRNLNFY